MPTEPGILPLAEALERAYRLALAMEALAKTPADRAALSATASELLGVLDRARASMLRPGANRPAGW
ncbi:hypothetical protein [Hydrogenophaga palleronii]|uniref:hypothetical protein n=1 Tax=Hydrogenophaga palleronii TaxID=65655 RepID=UPI000824C8A5|nr:hypothetical protein [Hydrogenophaga palleronii]